MAAVKKATTKKAPAKASAKTAAKPAEKKAYTSSFKMDKKAEGFLYEYLNANSPVGYETSGQQIWLDYLKPYIDDKITDVYGTAVGVINPGKKFSVVIEAHADEIAWTVNYITPDGYLYLARLGGSDHMIAPSMRVLVHGEKGIIPGIFGWPAIHVRDRAREEGPSMKNLCVDIGAKDRAEAIKMGVDIGTVITFADGLTTLNDRFYVGRALDNRLGGFVIAQVARMIKEKKVKLPYTLYIVNSVQEEIGLRGAEMISRRLGPNVAICMDVTHDTQSPFYNKKEQGDLACGKGPVITIAPAIQKKLYQLMIATAKAKKIPYQVQTGHGYSTGTDTDSFAYSGIGVASALLSIALKYMHTTVETVHKDDIGSTVDMYVEILKALKGNEDFRPIK
jgi:putative aminopeptidase FrvX